MLGILRKMHRLHGYIKDPKEMERYICTKKCIALVLLLVVAGTGVYDTFQVLVLERSTTFFYSFYNALIFCDILLVLVSQYYMPSFHATFRNSGYAVGTLMMRIKAWCAASCGRGFKRVRGCLSAEPDLGNIAFPSPAVKVPQEEERAQKRGESRWTGNSP